VNTEFERSFGDWVQALGPRNTEILLKATSSMELAANRVLIRDNMPVDSLYLILDGQVSISVEQNGRSVVIGTVGPGQVLGEVSVLSGKLEASSTVTSATPVRLLRLRHQAFEKLIATNYEIANVLLRYFVTMLAERVRTSIHSFAELKDRGVKPVPAAAQAQEKGKDWIRSFFDNIPDRG